MNNAIQTIKHTAEQVPAWVNWVVVAGSAATAWLAPIASIVAIVWGALQIYLAIERRWFRKDRLDRHDD